MTGRAAALAQLERLARLKSDLEMRRFSAYRAHVTAAEERIAAIRDDLQAIHAAPAAFSVAEARLANALAGERTRALLRAEADLRQMLPGFEAARALAKREFGRVEVLKTLGQDAAKAARDRAERKLRP
ncbi:hypothetical protein A6J80_08990 [Paracoccus yeei]|uniref:Uncharacterized protein n=2 Tax=Paracoccus TaxID=265 RepID=A0A1V0GRM1_9RHOB|nr:MULTISPECIES: hypothetical protein [Paracoccus]ARC36496.1 hypothetical protein A6J80_08990 [Paracoccus yeei]ATQ55125.1 hypothetical protein PYTT13_04465 [Paracoccus yeei]AWX92989.1 hypothetical protein DPM13_07105 [Paracoccus mutanolyticus]AYF02422.1 hypothetical protein PY32053_02834 [Paracoccus yeei]MBY0134623.1 hypothetical protein [Paracoccus yeei]